MFINLFFFLIRQGTFGVPATIIRTSTQPDRVPFPLSHWHVRQSAGFGQFPGNMHWPSKVKIACFLFLKWVGTGRIEYFLWFKISCCVYCTGFLDRSAVETSQELLWSFSRSINLWKFKSCLVKLSGSHKIAAPESYWKVQGMESCKPLDIRRRGRNMCTRQIMQKLNMELIVGFQPPNFILQGLINARETFWKWWHEFLPCSTFTLISLVRLMCVCF